MALAALVLVVLVVAFLPVRHNLHRYVTEDNRAVEELFYREDHTATVRVYRTPAGDKFVSVDGHFIGATEHESDRKQKLLGHLPFLLVPEIRTAITIGLGSGITLAAMARHPGLQRLEAVEIVPSMVQAAQYFADENDNVLHRSGIHIYVDDGLHLIRATDRRYDVIVSDAKLNPEYVGNALVYTREYYLWSREHLTETGIFCQWVPLYLPPRILDMVLRTFTEAFPVAELWYFPQQHLILTGRRQDYPFDATQLAQRMQNPKVLSHLRQFGLTSAYSVISAWLADRHVLRELCGDGPVNTYQHPILEFLSVRAFRQAPRSRVQRENLHRLYNRRSNADGPFVHLNPDSLAAFRRSGELVIRGMLEALETDMLSRGRRFFRQALAINPADGRARDLLMLADKEAGALETLPVSASERPQLTIKSARYLYERGDLQQAEALLRRLLERQKNSVDAWNLLGLVLQKRNDMQGALQAFQQAHRLDRRNVDVLLNLGMALEKLGRYRQAVDILNQAAAIDPTSARVQNNLGVLYSRQGQLQNAERALNAALAIDPGMAQAWNNLGIVYGRQGRLDQALQAFRQALRLQPDHLEALRNLGITYLQMENFASAAFELEKVVQLVPGDADSWLNLGLAYARLGRFDEARRCWETALLHNPNLQEARRNLDILEKMRQ